MALPKKKGRCSSQIDRLGLECLFLTYNDDGNYVIYTLQFKCQAIQTAWNVSKRYNEFYELNSELQKDRNFSGIKLPHFPGKAMAFTDASKKELAEERMQHLQIYLNYLISRTVFLSSGRVRAFLNMPVAVKDLAVILANRQNTALKEGYMEHREGEIYKTWRRRWFVLHPNYILKYYKDGPHDLQIEGAIDISSIVQVEMKNVSKDKQYSFTLITKESQWLLSCKNQTEKREWTIMFMRLCDTKQSSFKNVMITQLKWCPTIPGVLATGSQDESVKIWQTHLLDHATVEYDNDEIDKILCVENNEEKKELSKYDKDMIYNSNAIEFQLFVEYKTSGQVTCLEWSPDGSMLVASLRTEIDNKNHYHFIECFDLRSKLIDSGLLQSFDVLNNNNNDSRTKLFKLQHEPIRLTFSNDGNVVYIAVNIDPNSVENKLRRPAFLIHLNLEQEKLLRCRTIDRIIYHQTEFIACLAMNNARTVLVVATSTHQGNGRVIVWDIEKNETRIVERKGTRITSLLFTADNSWLIVGRVTGKLEFWKASSSLLFEKKYEETIHEASIFNVTSSNGILISSTKANESILWDIKPLLNGNNRAKLIGRLSDMNDSNNNTIHLLALSPVTQRHVTDGCAPGGLLAVSNDHNIYCHNTMDILLDIWDKSKYQVESVDIVQNKQLQQDLERIMKQLKEMTMANLEQTNNIVKYQNELNEYKITTESLIEQITKLQTQNNKLMNEQKEMETKYQCLLDENKELKHKNIDISEYKTWRWENIIQWMLMIEDSRFVKYEDELRAALSQEQPGGEDLHQVNEGDIKRWGVTVFKDIKMLYKNIQQLTQQNNVSNIPDAENEGIESGGHYK